MPPARRRFGPQQIGSFWESVSPKLGRVVRLQSRLEYYNWILVEADAEIESFCERPRWIEVGPGWSVPEMWVQFRSGRQQLREIKRSTDLEFDRNGLIANRQIVIQQRWCQENGIGHIVLTEIDLLANPVKLENWRRILRYLCQGGGMDENLKSAVLEFVTSKIDADLREIRHRFLRFDESAIDRCVFKLLQEGLFNSDLDARPLAQSSRFSKHDEQESFQS